MLSRDGQRDQVIYQDFFVSSAGDVLNILINKNPEGQIKYLFRSSRFITLANGITAQVLFFYMIIPKQNAYVFFNVIAICMQYSNSNKPANDELWNRKRNSVITKIFNEVSS